MFKSTLQTAFRSRSRWKLTSWLPTGDSIAREQSLLHLLSIGCSQRILIADLVSNYAEEHRGWYRRRLRQFAGRLKETNSLPDAIEQSPGIVSDHSAMAIRFGSQLGTLEQTFERLLEIDARSINTTQVLLRRAWIYGLLTALVFLAGVSFVNMFVFPVLNEIYEELGLQQIFVMIWDLTLWEATVAWLPLILLVVIVAAFVAWSSPSRRFLRRKFSLVNRRPKAWHTAQILQLLALTIK